MNGCLYAAWLPMIAASIVTLSRGQAASSETGNSRQGSGPAAAVQKPNLSPGATNRYSTDRVLTETNYAGAAGQPSRRVRIVAREGKYPNIRVAETLSRDQQTGVEKLVSEQSMVADHVIVKMKPGVAKVQLDDLCRKWGYLIRKQLHAPQLYLVETAQVDCDSVPSAITQFKTENAIIAYAEPDYIVHALTIPDDTRFSELWGMHNAGQSGGTVDADIDAPEAWDLSIGSTNVLVGIIDTGVDHTHPDLAANLWTNPREVLNGIDDDGNGFVDDIRGWDFVHDDNDPTDDNNHGTHVAGTIGAVGNNATGVAGVCWRVSIVAMKFLGADGRGFTSDAIEAVAYATQIGVDLTSNSWGGAPFSQLLKDVIDAAGTAGILFVAAAGNDNSDNDQTPHYPSSYASPNIIAVAATDHNDAKASFSNFGATSVDLGAPGSAILSTVPGHSYAFFNGTSMATPHVSGACALLKAFAPSLTHLQIKQIIMNSTDPLASLSGKTVAGGRLNVFKALSEANPLIVTAPASATEGAGVLTGQGKVSLNSAAATNLTVNLVSSAAHEATVPAAVTIAAGATNATFDITIVDDALLDGTQIAAITAVVPGFAAGTGSIAVHDNETAALSLSVPGTGTVTEGLAALVATLTVSAAPDRDVAVNLNSSDPSEVQAPPSVVIPAGRTNTTFNAAVVDDSEIDGTQTATITAQVQNWANGTAVITVNDNENTDLVLKLPAEANESNGVLKSAGIAQISGTLSSNLVVSLSSSNTTEVTVPGSVTILSGKTVALFDVTIVDDAMVDGAQTAAITASAAGFASASANIKVADDESPPPPINPVPPHLSTNAPVTADLAWTPEPGEGVDLMVNGGFETGDFTGWSQQSTGGAWVINDGTFDPAGPAGPLPPYAGRFSAVTDVPASGRRVLWQEITVPNSPNAVLLQWADRIRNHGSFFSTDEQFRVEIRGTNDNTVAVVYTTQAGDPLLNDWTERSFDISTFRGQTIRAAFIEEDNLLFINVHLDNAGVRVMPAVSTTYDVFFGSNPTPGASEWLGRTTNTAWNLPNLAPLTTYFWQIVGQRAGLTAGPVWQFTTRGVDHFEWSAISSPQITNLPFTATITAQDEFNTPVTNFAGAIKLSGWSSGGVSSHSILGSPTPTHSFNSGTFTLGYSFTPNTNIVVTHVRHYSGSKVSVWTEGGALLASQSVVSTPATWVETPLATPLPLSAGTRYRAGLLTGGTPYFLRYDQSPDFTHGVINQSYNIFGDGFPTVGDDGVRWWFVDLRYTVALLAEVAITPAVSGPFTNGAWTGDIAVPQPALDMFLQAEDAAGHVGRGNNFMVVQPDDLSLSMKGSVDPVVAGKNLTYTLSVNNSGPSSSTEVTVTNVLPAGVTFVSAVSSHGSFTNQGNLVICNIGTLTNQLTAVVTIQVTPKIPGVITNMASVHRNEADPNLANNVAAAVTTVIPHSLISITDALVHESRTGTSVAQFEVGLSQPNTRQVSVQFSTADGTATAGSDYVAANGTVVFSPGSIRQTISVVINADAVKETNETFFVNLSSPVIGEIADNQAAGLIFDQAAPSAPSPPHLSTNEPVTVDLAWEPAGDAANLIKNGGFEDGDLTSWITQDVAGYGWRINDGTLDPNGPEGPLPPFAGRFSAVTDAPYIGRYLLYQEITIPSTTNSVLLQWVDRIRSYGPFATNTQFSVEIRGTNDNTLAVVYTTRLGDPLLNDWKERSFDISTFQGQTVRLAFIQDQYYFVTVHLDKIRVRLSSSSLSFDVFFGTQPIPGPTELLGSAANTAWDLPTLAPLTTYYWQIVDKNDPSVPGPVWQFTTRGVNRFEWSAVSSPQTVDQPFSATITAQDEFNTAVTNFLGPVAIHALAEFPSQPVRLLSFIRHADLLDEYQKTMQAISTHFTNFAESVTVAPNAAALATDLAGKDVFLVVEQELAPTGAMAALGREWAAVLNQFVESGGTVLVCSHDRDEHLVLTESGLLNLNKLGDSTSASVDKAADHVLTAGVSFPFAASLIARYAATDGLVVVKTVSGNETVVAARDLGLGHVVMVGTDFFTLGTGLDRIIANAVRWAQTKPVLVTPVLSGTFTNGAWTGGVRVHEPSTSTVLGAADGGGHSGTSNPFAVTGTPGADLAISLTAPTGLINVGNLITYGITVTNQGPNTASDIIVTDHLPGGVTASAVTTKEGIRAISGGIVTISIGSLPSGGAASISLSATVTAFGGLTNVATVSSTTRDPVIANNTATVVIVVNAPPTISTIPDQTTYDGAPTIPIPFTIGDLETPANNLTLSGNSSDTALVPNANIFLGGTSSSRTVAVTPAPGKTGTAKITVAVSDGSAQASTSFTLTVASNTPRLVRVVNSDGKPGGDGSLGIELLSLGDENALGFSLTFDTNTLSFVSAVLGSGATDGQLNVNSNLASNGRLGLGLSLGTGANFAAGTQQVAVVTFAISTNPPSNLTFIGFGDQPVIREVSDMNALTLPANYQAGTFEIIFGYEADVAPRPNGNNTGAIGITDWVQAGRFAAALDAPTSTNEFQRADCAPRMIGSDLARGNGVLSITDWVQAGLYSAALSPVTIVGGPTGPPPPGGTAEGSALAQTGAPRSTVSRKASLFGGATRRWIGATDLVAQTGQASFMAVEIEAEGDENAAGFSLNFNPVALRFTELRLASGASGATLLANTTEVSSGRLGIVLALPAGQSFGAGLRALVEVGFMGLPASVGSMTRVNFGDQPVVREVAGVTANPVESRYFSGAVSIPDSKSVSLYKPAPFSLSVRGISGEGALQLRVAGESGTRYVVETSPDLVTWLAVRTVSMTSAVFDFEENQVTHSTGRYYRVVIAP